MSKATKNFIAGALVATLPLFVASLMKDDPQVAHAGAGTVVLDSAQALAAELDLSHSAGLIAPYSSIDTALQMPETKAKNIRFESSATLFGSEMHVSETFTVDILVHKKLFDSAYIYSNQCTFSGGDLLRSVIVSRPASSLNWVDENPDFRASGANFLTDGHRDQCQRLDRSGVFDEVRKNMDEARNEAKLSD